MSYSGSALFSLSLSAQSRPAAPRCRHLHGPKAEAAAHGLHRRAAAGAGGPCEQQHRGLHWEAEGQEARQPSGEGGGGGAVSVLLWSYTSECRRGRGQRTEKGKEGEETHQAKVVPTLHFTHSYVCTKCLPCLVSYVQFFVFVVTHQAIIVRRPENRHNLHKDLRSAGATVLTVPESKGLEMNDVLLYNFWADSLAKDEWRWLLNYLELMDSSSVSGVVVGHQGRRFPLDFPFDADKFKLLETELKQLYVAITRPRARLWIFDQGRDGRGGGGGDQSVSAASGWCRTPVFEFLQRTGLVEVMFENTDDIEPFARASESTAEIEAAARQLYARGCRDSNADMLLTAGERFEEAGKHTQAELCRARYLVSELDR